MWKVVATILNLRLIESITFHDFLHGFLAVHDTGTATLEAKLLQKLAALMEEVMYVIFLYLHKAYDALDRSMCLDFLEGYGMVPQARCLLQTYWRWLTMVARAGGYYRTAFQGARGVTQVDPLSLTIFNVVLDVVVRHWVMVMVEGTEERGERGQEGRHQASIFYVYDGMVALLDPRCIQGAFYTLVGMFGRLGLRTNVGKTVNMFCRPCQAAGNQLEEAYGIRVTGEGPTYWE